MSEFRFEITQKRQDMRIDVCILEEYGEALGKTDDTAALSRSYVQRLIKEGGVSVNEKTVKQNYRVRQGDIVCLLLPDAIAPDILPENIPLSILYEDKDLLIVDKPKGMVVHPAPGHYSGTLVNAVLYHCKEGLSGINGILRPGIVHRIDRDTTGSLLICKNDKTHNAIAMQLNEHSITRKYRAICHGVIAKEEGVVDAPIGRHPHDRTKMAVVPCGKTAVTHYKVLQRFSKHTYVECTLETGRTHQIRVHMAKIGYPLLGDGVYATGRMPCANIPFPLEGQTLHAMTIGFVHPGSGAYLEVSAPLPEYFKELLQIL